MLPLSVENFAGQKVEEDQLKQVLQFALWRLEALRIWERDEIFQSLKTLAEQMDMKMKDLNGPLFVAVTGSTASISIMDSMTLLGPDMTRARLRHAVNLFGVPGKKQLKKLEKAYNAL